MRYQIPTDAECADILTDAEFQACPTERVVIERARAKAWADHCASGPSGQLRGLSQGSIGDSVLLGGYTQSRQVSSLVASVSISESAQFRCSLERSLIDGAVTGVRVTLVRFTK